MLWISQDGYEYYAYNSPTRIGLKLTNSKEI